MQSHISVCNFLLWHWWITTQGRKHCPNLKFLLYWAYLFPPSQLLRYAHHITTSLPPPPYFQTFLRPCYCIRQRISQKPIYDLHCWYKTEARASQRAKFAEKVHKPPLWVHVINFVLNGLDASIWIPWSPSDPKKSWCTDRIIQLHKKPASFLHLYRVRDA